MNWIEWIRWYFNINPPLGEHGILNFDVIVPSKIYCGGQPLTKESWAYIESLGVETVIKLNYPDEGVDDGAVAFGMKVIDCSMPPRDLPQALGKPDIEAVNKALTELSNPNNGITYIHCSHGQDRTRLIVGMFLVKYRNWTCHAAYKNMLKHGFHWVLPDLDECWEHFCKTQDALDFVGKTRI